MPSACALMYLGQRGNITLQKRSKTYQSLFTDIELRSRYLLGTCFRFINRAEKELEQETVKSIFIEWAFESNITDLSEKNKLAQQVRKNLISRNEI